MHLDHELGEISARRGEVLICPGPVTVEEERQELETVLQSSAINRSVNLVRFLQFVCAKYFEGEAEDIRERSVAVEALGRKEANFDSHADPIVRVTARDLRKKLDDYYAGEGRDHAIQIVLPRGRYIPQFIRRPSLEEVEHLPPAVGIGTHDLAAASILNRPEEPADITPPTVVPTADARPRAVWKVAAAAATVGCAFTAGLLVGHRQAATKTLAVPVFWGAPAWSDEFDGAAHKAPSAANWVDDDAQSVHPGTPCGVGASCAGGHNAFLDGEGHLVLRASRDPNGSWNTAKLSTRGLHDFKYGRIEARIKLPVGSGLWPAFWMMGSSFPRIGWPNAGSVDIMENVTPHHAGDDLGPNVIRSTLHGPAYFGQSGLWQDYRLPGQQRVDGDFHTYGIIWSPQRVQFYVDDPANVFFEKNAGQMPKGTQWVFDQPFYLVMNLAVGGDWPGSADNTTPNPSDMIVDYVRAYPLPDVLGKDAR